MLLKRESEHFVRTFVARARKYELAIIKRARARARNAPACPPIKKLRKTTFLHIYTARNNGAQWQISIETVVIFSSNSERCAFISFINCERETALVHLPRNKYS